MKNPYDSYLMRKDKPKVIGFYLGEPVYEGEESRVAFWQTEPEWRHRADMTRLELGRKVFACGQTSSALDANINLALGCLGAVLLFCLLVVL